MRDELTLAIRKARRDDAAALARVYVASAQDAFAGLLPLPLLSALTEKGQAARFRNQLGAAQAQSPHETLLAVETKADGIIAMASLGHARDTAIGFDGEIYALHVDPGHYGIGIGSALLRAAFAHLSATDMRSCVIWAHARGPSRFFCEAMGGRCVAERLTTVMGESVPEAAYGWRNLVLAERSAAR